MQPFSGIWQPLARCFISYGPAGDVLCHWLVTFVRPAHHHAALAPFRGERTSKQKSPKKSVKPGWFRTASRHWLRPLLRARLSAALPTVLPPFAAAVAHLRCDDARATARARSSERPARSPPLGQVASAGRLGRIISAELGRNGDLSGCSGHLEPFEILSTCRQM